MRRTAQKDSMKETTAPSSPRILACDPSLTAWGWAVLENGKIIRVGVLVTKPEAKKRKIREGDDMARRTRELIQELVRIIREYDVALVVSEQPHGSQNSRGAMMIGIVLGTLEGICYMRKLALEWCLESDAKKALLGRISATKDEVKEAVDKLYDVTWSGVKYADEAVADALAVYHWGECNSPTIKFMSR